MKGILQYLQDFIRSVAALDCPEAAGWEGADTFPDCGKCVVCECKRLIKDIDKSAF